MSEGASGGGRAGGARAGGGAHPGTGAGAAVHRLLGDLEAEIMDIMWRRSEATVRDVLGELAQRRELAYTTVMTVMARLADKGLLRRHLEGKAHWYEVVQSREEFLRGTSQRLVRTLIEEFGDVAMAAMLQQVEREVGRVESARLARLERLRRLAGVGQTGARVGAARGAARPRG